MPFVGCPRPMNLSPLLSLIAPATTLPTLCRSLRSTRKVVDVWLVRTARVVGAKARAHCDPVDAGAQLTFDRVRLASGAWSKNPRWTKAARDPAHRVLPFRACRGI